MKILFLILFIYFFGSCFAYDCKPTLNGKKYDFSPLMRTTSDYIQGRASIGKGWDLVLNMCTPVLERVCPPNTAVCQVWDYNCPNPGCGSASLGSAGQATFSLRDGQVILHFLAGDEGRSAEIRFSCAPGTGIGTFSFTNEDPIKQYNVAWYTEYACPVVEPTSPPNSNCTFKLGEKEIDFSPMRQSSDFYVQPEYSLNICGPLLNRCISNVSDSIACQRLPNVELSLGNFNNFTYSWNPTNLMLNVTYSGGDAGRMSNYLLMCSKDYENPFFFNESPIKVYNFIWRNPLVCNSSFVETLLKK